MEQNKKSRKQQKEITLRPDLSDGSRGKDLSYLSEMPQMAGYEGVKAGLPEEQLESKTKRNEKNETNRS